MQDEPGPNQLGRNQYGQPGEIESSQDDAGDVVGEEQPKKQKVAGAAVLGRFLRRGSKLELFFKRRAWHRGCREVEGRNEESSMSHIRRGWNRR